MVCTTEPVAQVTDLQSIRQHSQQHRCTGDAAGQRDIPYSAKGMKKK